VSTARAVRREIVAWMADPEAPNPANPIHSGSGARAYGFAAALVGGVHVYGFAVGAILDALGPGWLEHGFAELEFRRPVYPNERLVVSVDGDGTLTVSAADHDVRLRGRVGLGDAPWRDELIRPVCIAPEDPASPRPRLCPENVPVGADLRARAVHLAHDEMERFCREKQNEQLACFYGRDAFAHAAWIAGQPIHLLHHSFDYGPAVHTASRIQHVRAVRNGETVVVAGRCVDAFERKGHHYIVNDCVLLDREGRTLTQLRHTAIYRLAAPAGGHS
jgi:acyl dehydratase